MSTLPVTDSQTSTASSAPAGEALQTAVCLPPMTSDARTELIYRLQAALPGDGLVFASPEQTEEAQMEGDGPLLVPYPVQRTGSEWVLTAPDYAAAARLAQERRLSGVLLLGSDAGSMDTESLVQSLTTLRRGADLVLPRYQTGAQEGLVNSALIYPLSRALFGMDVRFPLPLDAGISARLLTRLAAVANRFGREADGFIWPVAEAATAGMRIQQVDGVHRALPHPQEADLNVLLPTIMSSIFIDLENKAAYWQRARPAATRHISAVTNSATPDNDNMTEVRELVENFRRAFANLREIWALVLPPQSLLALKKLTSTPAEVFAFPPNLWARVVYDFALAFHTRTLNRGHLLGSMTPMYLAWVAGLLRERPEADALRENTAAAFEQEMPYLVSRWRWPDRFNP